MGAGRKGGCLERLNSTMQGEGLNIWRVVWKETMKLVHIKGAAPLIAGSSSSRSKVNSAGCMATCFSS